MIKRLSKEEEKIVKDWQKIYKHVSKCSNCKDIFGHDKPEEKLCPRCDPKFHNGRFNDR